MTTATILPILLGLAWLLPLVSFVVVCVGFSIPQALGRSASYRASAWGGRIAIAAIATSFALSLVALLFVWLPEYGPGPVGHAEDAQHASDHAATSGGVPAMFVADSHSTEDHANNPPPPYYAGDWYTLAEFDGLKLSIGYYIDTLTVVMMTMVSLIAMCVHIYATGYMHDELEDYTDTEVWLDSGHPLKRRGRYHRFFQYLSLFSFSMLGLVIAGNLAMVFVFWELVGICSYFLIGFYFERDSASTAANKAFIVNRVGDFGFLIGLMALWASLGTFHFGDWSDDAGSHQGLFSQLRTEANDYALVVPPAMAAEAARGTEGDGNRAGYWLLCVAGVGIFCGCVGKSAQFPLHVWLPDAMEGPTPVSALVHSATMVAAGVYLVGRAYPLFTPETLLVIAVVGCITLALAATIAITAVDIKRVLAYSTVSQLGYMMLSLGLGGWVAGLFHLITHAFFKSLLFLCSGSVIHAVHTNDMRLMGGLRHKMPITAYTMLVGCLAIIGAGIPTTAIGLSGYYSKDAIIEQAWSFASVNAAWRYQALLIVPLAGAAVTAFYMFRLWFMTFTGEPRDHHRYDHAHESPPSMTRPLLLLAVFAVGVGWSLPFTGLSITSLLEQATPVGTQATTSGLLLADLVVPDEHQSHVDAIRIPAGLAAFTAAMLGVLLAAAVYVWRWFDAEEMRQSFRPAFSLLWHKWWFDEIYNLVFVRPTKWIAMAISFIDRQVIDRFVDWLARAGRGCAAFVDKFFDRNIVDRFLDGLASGFWRLGKSLHFLQTGRLRTYVVFIVVGTLTTFALVSVLWKYAVAG